MVISLACHQQRKSEVTSALVGAGSVAAELPLYEARKEYCSTSALAGLHSNTAPLPEGIPCTREVIKMWSCFTVGYSRMISWYYRVTLETRGHGGKQRGNTFQQAFVCAIKQQIITHLGLNIGSTMFKGLILCNIHFTGWLLVFSTSYHQ